MSDSVREQLSAFIDGELPETEAELLLRRLGGDDDDLRARAGHYELIGSVLRRERSVSAAFASRIQSELEDEPAHSLASERQPARVAASGRFARLAAGGAIAASVALLAVFGLRSTDPIGTEPAAIAESDLRAERETYTTPVANPASSPVDLRLDPQLVNYMLRHSRTTQGLSGDDMGERIISSDISGRSDTADDANAAGSDLDDEAAAVDAP